MIWFSAFQMIAFAVFGFAVFLAYKYRRDKLDDLEEWFTAKWKLIIKLYLLWFVVISMFMSGPLWSTVTCKFDGYAANTETSYSWYKGKCLYKTKTGAWLPLNISRDQPEGDHVDTSQ